MFLLRKTYGWNKKQDRISLAEFSQATGIKRVHVHRALKSLLSRRVTAITHTGNREPLSYSFQKDYSKWGLSPIRVTGGKLLPKRGTDLLPKRGTDLLPKRVTSKDKYKYKEKQKDILAIGMAFSDFWKAYPRKVKKPDAEKAWKQVHPTKEELKKIIQDIEARWKGKDIQFIPHPGTYLRNRRWEDESDELDRFAFFAKGEKRDERTDVSGRDEEADGLLPEEDADA